ncbi:hypothetical protein [Polaromonas aquatica]|uniref:hypothetical protein n=1 Tax=Polaromonas aquatica TaxID=332657 RepID=UPI003D6482BF
MPSNEKIAVAAHLHVLLRRKTGRVTDTEWMAGNPEYAAAIARFAREKAAEEGHVDLAVWADRLEEIMAVPETQPRVPLVKMVADAVKERAMPAVTPAPTTDRQSARSVDTEEEVYPESGFIESTFGTFFGEDESPRERKYRDPDAPRYVKGLR